MPSSNLALLLSGAFLTSLVLSLSGTYLVRGWAIRKGFVDHPDSARRIHTAPTPNVGGVAIVVASQVLSRRRRSHLVGYGLGLLPGLVVLYFVYVNVNRLLPPNL